VLWPSGFATIEHAELDFPERRERSQIGGYNASKAFASDDDAMTIVDVKQKDIGCPSSRAVLANREDTRESNSST
jgi:hypothetical protein